MDLGLKQGWVVHIYASFSNSRSAASVLNKMRNLKKDRPLTFERKNIYYKHV